MMIVVPRQRVALQASFGSAARSDSPRARTIVPSRRMCCLPSRQFVALPGNTQATTPKTTAAPLALSGSSLQSVGNFRRCDSVELSSETLDAETLYTVDAPSLDHQQGRLSPRRILVAVDDSSLSEAAMSWVVDNLVSPNTDELRILHVVSGNRDEYNGECDSSNSSDTILSSSHLSGEPLFSSGSISEEVFPLPREALQERWATQARGFLQQRFMSKLDSWEVPYEVDLVKEYGPDQPRAIGHCICDAAEGLEASMVVVAHRAGAPLTGNGPSISSFVAHYCRRPVILLNENQLRLQQHQHQHQHQPRHADESSSSSSSSRRIVFAVDHRYAPDDSWALDWALQAMCKQGDEVHLVHIAEEDGVASTGGATDNAAASSVERAMSQVRSRAQHLGLGKLTSRHLAAAISPEPSSPAPSQGDGSISNFEHLGRSLISLTREVGAHMLFVVNHSYDSSLQDFLRNSVSGQCLLNNSCPTVVFHANSDSSINSREQQQC